MVWDLADTIGMEPDPAWDPQGWIGYSPDGTLLASRTQIRSTADWQVRYRFDADPQPSEFPLAFSPDGRMLIFGGTNSARILWIGPGPTVRLLDDYQFWGTKTLLSFFADGTRLIMDGSPRSLDLRVEPAPVLPSLTPALNREGNLLKVRVNAVTNSVYTLQVSPDMQHWQDWTNSVVSGIADSQEWRVEKDLYSQFYRLRME